MKDFPLVKKGSLISTFKEPEGYGRSILNSNVSCSPHLLTIFPKQFGEGLLFAELVMIDVSLGGFDIDGHATTDLKAPVKLEDEESLFFA